MTLLQLPGQDTQTFTFPAPSIMLGRHANAGEDGQEAIVVIAAQAGLRNTATYLLWSYDAAPTGGQITITDGEVTITLYVTTAGPGLTPGLCRTGSYLKAWRILTPHMLGSQMVGIARD